MKNNVLLFWFGIIISIISLIGSVIFYYYVIDNFYYNLSNNILAGGIILIGTSIFSYLNEKKKVKTNLQNILISLNSDFSKIKYFEPNIVTYEYMCNDCKNNKLKKPTECEYNEYVVRQQEKIYEYLDPYEKIIKNQYNDLRLLYDDMYFLFDIFKFKRKKFYNKIFKYLYYDIICEIRKYSASFIYIRKSIAYYDIVYEQLSKIQELVFETKECEINWKKDSTIENTNFNLIIRDVYKNKDKIIGNKISYYISNDLFKYIESKF